MEGQITIFVQTLMEKHMEEVTFQLDHGKQVEIFLEERQDRGEKFWEGVSCKQSRIEEKEDLLHLGVKGGWKLSFQDRMISSVTLQKRPSGITMKT